MKKNPYLICLIIFFSSILSFGFITEEDPLKAFLSKLSEYNESTMHEKVHLHFDKPYYAVGDTIWFKSYVVNADNNQLSNRSKILYVDLINEKDSLKKSLRLPVVAGLAWGDFVLPDSYTEGNYRIRAYTTWMRNFDEAYFYDKTIKVGNSLTNEILTTVQYKFSKSGSKENVEATITYTDFKGEPYKEKAVSYNIGLDNRNILSGKGITDNLGKLKVNFPNTQPFILKSGHLNTFITLDKKNTVKKVFPVKATSDAISVQFFPESGNLINGVRSRVAFKVVGADGLGKNATGIIMDASEKITDLKSEYAGMGTFSFTPVDGHRYTAKVKFDDGSEKIFELPKPKESGFVLTVNNENAKDLVIKITPSAKEKAGEEIIVIGQSNGIIKYVSKSKLNGAPVFASVSKKRFPTGILQLTLLNSSYQPLAERLAFIRHQASSMNVSPDKETYSPRSPAKFNFKTLDSIGQPIRGSFSVAVTNESEIPFDDISETTILSNLLLSSDLRGYVETPNYYFTNLNQQKEKALDNLLLTQGWRTFDWKSAKSGHIPSFVYKPEQSINISGKITEANGRPSVRSEVTLISSTGNKVILDTLTDASGRFNFDNLAFSEGTSFIVQSKNAKGKKNVNLLLDQTPPQLITKNINSANIEINVNQSLLPYLTYRATQFAEMRKKGLLQREIILDEVKVVTVKPKVKHSSNLNGAGNADAIVSGDVLPRDCFDLATCLQGRISGVVVQGKKVYLARNLSGNLMSGPTPMQIIVDGSYVEPEYLALINITDVDNIEVLKSVGYTGIYGMRGTAGVLIINTKRGEASSTVLSTVLSRGIASYSPQGYYLSRQFYSPKYAEPEINKIADLRSTIYWAPNVITDDGGKASVNFYTSDQPGTYKAVIEGVDLNGSLTRQVFRFNVAR